MANFRSVNLNKSIYIEPFGTGVIGDDPATRLESIDPVIDFFEVTSTSLQLGASTYGMAIIYSGSSFNWDGTDSCYGLTGFINQETMIDGDEVRYVLSNISATPSDYFMNATWASILEGNDEIFVSNQNDVVYAGSGNDVVYGYDGNDQLYGEAGDDQIDGGDGSDRILGGVGNDQLRGGAGSDSIYGGLGDDFLSGGGENDLLNGGLGVNNLIGGAGDDTLTGQRDGSGTNIANYSGATSGITAVFSNASSVLGDISVGTDSLIYIDHIYGTAFSDTFTVNSSWSGSQYDGYYALPKGAFISIRAGAGNDTIIGNGFTRLDFSDSTEGVLVRFTGEGSGGVIGNASIGTDIFTGVNSLFGSLHNDFMTGSTAPESFRPSRGDDVIDGGAGGGDRIDYFYSNDAVSVDLSLNTPQTISEWQGRDTLINIENVRGSNFSDQVKGSNAANVIWGFDGDDTVDGGDGNDVLYGGKGDDELVGAKNADTIFGDQGDDLLRGGNGLDKLDGGVGNDTLLGALGRDTLTGGEGSDVFRFTTVLDGDINIDLITDYESGVDRIELLASVFTAFSGKVGQTLGLGENLTYDSVTRALSYDQDGSAGVAEAKAFAILGVSNHPATNIDFVIV